MDIAAVLKVIYGFKVIFKILLNFFYKLEECKNKNPKIVTEAQSWLIPKVTLNRKSKSGVTIPYFKLYYRDTLNRGMAANVAWFITKQTNISMKNKWPRNKSMSNSLDIENMTKPSKIYTRVIPSSLTNSDGQIGCPHKQKFNYNPIWNPLWKLIQNTSKILIYSLNFWACYRKLER